MEDLIFIHCHYVRFSATPSKLVGTTVSQPKTTLTPWGWPMTPTKLSSTWPPKRRWWKAWKRTLERLFTTLKQVWPLIQFYFVCLCVENHKFALRANHWHNTPFSGRASFTQSSNSLVSVSDLWRPFWADMAPFKGPQPCLTRCPWNNRDI